MVCAKHKIFSPELNKNIGIFIEKDFGITKRDRNLPHFQRRTKAKRDAFIQKQLSGNRARYSFKGFEDIPVLRMLWA